MHDLELAKDLLADGRFGIYQDNLSMMQEPQGIQCLVTMISTATFPYLLCHQRLGGYVHHFGDGSPITLTELSDDPQVLLSQLDLALSTVEIEVRNLLGELSVIARSRALSDGACAVSSSCTIY